MLRPTRRILVASVALTVALAAGGCGSSAPTPTPSDAARPSGSAPASSPRASGSPSAAASTSASPSAAAPSASASIEPSAGAPGASPTYESPEDLAVGDCYDPILDRDDDLLLAAIMLPCSSGHRHEVFGVVDVAGAPSAPFPGSTDLDAEAQDLCDAAFEAYVGIEFDRSSLGYVYYTPTEATWPAGDRTVLCVVEDGGRAIEGTVKGSAR